MKQSVLNFILLPPSLNSFICALGHFSFSTTNIFFLFWMIYNSYYYFRSDIEDNIIHLPFCSHHLNLATAHLEDLLDLAPQTLQHHLPQHINLQDSSDKNNSASVCIHIQYILIHILSSKSNFLYIGDCQPSRPVWIF